MLEPALIVVDERSEETTLYSGANHPLSHYFIKRYYIDTRVQKVAKSVTFYFVYTRVQKVAKSVTFNLVYTRV